MVCITSQGIQLLAAIAQLIAAVTTIVLVVLTWRYVTQTKNMVKEMKATREEQSRPYVIVDLDSEAGNTIDLVVRNLGLTAARDIRINIDPPLIGREGREINRLSFIENGIPSLPPRKEIRALIDFGPDFFNSGKPLQYTATVSYSPLLGDLVYEDKYVLDLNIYRGFLVVTKYGVHDIHTQLKDMNKLLKKMLESI